MKADGVEWGCSGVEGGVGGVMACLQALFKGANVMWLACSRVQLLACDGGASRNRTRRREAWGERAVNLNILNARDLPGFICIRPKTPCPTSYTFSYLTGSNLYNVITNMQY